MKRNDTMLMKNNDSCLSIIVVSLSASSGTDVCFIFSLVIDVLTDCSQDAILFACTLAGV